MATSLPVIVDWLESLPKTKAGNGDELMAAFKAQFPRVPLVALLEAIEICEARALERDKPAGTA